MGLSPSARDGATPGSELSRGEWERWPWWAARPHRFWFVCHPHLLLHWMWPSGARSLYPHCSCQEEEKRNKNTYSCNLRLLPRNFTSCFCLRSFHGPALGHRVPRNSSASVDFVPSRAQPTTQGLCLWGGKGGWILKSD